MFDAAGPYQEVLGHALSPEQVAEVAWQALHDERFLVLPHPEVAAYYARRRATPTGGWPG